MLKVDESLAALRNAQLVQADMLCDLILEIRRILIAPDMQNHVKLAAIAEAVDELAPPPPPDLLGPGHVPEPRLPSEP